MIKYKKLLRYVPAVVIFFGISIFAVINNTAAAGNEEKERIIAVSLLFIAIILALLNVLVIAVVKAFNSNNDKSPLAVLNKLLYSALTMVFFIIVIISIRSFFFPDPYYFQEKTNNKMFALLILLLFLALLHFVKQRIETDSNNLLRAAPRHLSDFTMIFLFALCIRLCFVAFYGYSTSPTSDFGRAHETALGSTEYLLNYKIFNYEIFPSWAFFSLYLRFIYNLIFPHYLTAQLFNVLFSSLTAAILYVLAYRFTKKREIALFSGLIFAFYPTNIFYNVILTPEHFAVFVSCLAILLLTSKTTKTRYKLIFCGIAGILCSVMNYLKPMALVLIIAYLISVFFNALINKEKTAKKTAVSKEKTAEKTVVSEEKTAEKIAAGEEKTTNKTVVSEEKTVVGTIISKIKTVVKFLSAHNKKIIPVLSVLLLIIIFSISNLVINKHIENKLGIKIADSSNTNAHFLYIGLQPSGEGQIHLGDNPKIYYYFLDQTDRDFEQAKNLTYDFLKEKIKENPMQFIMLFTKKFRWAWQDDTIPAYYIKENANEYTIPAALVLCENLFSSLSQLFYIFIIIFSLIFFLHKIKTKFNFGTFFLSVFCFGFICLLLISEAQSRYKCMVVPFLCIFAAHGFSLLYNGIKNKIQNYDTKIKNAQNIVNNN